MHRTYAVGEKVLFSTNVHHNLIGQIVGISSKGVEVKSYADGVEKTFMVPFDSIIREHSSKRLTDVDNMVALSDLSPFTILENLSNRYKKSQIYTYIGNIVITVNPYKDLLIDGPEVMQQYFNKVITKAPPHLYGLAETIYQAVVHEYSNQVVVISGESGSGKTEAFKRITRYLAAASEHRGPTLSSVAQRVLESTPVLESFGNATTLRNDNSSRFGKYVEIYFANSIIVGAKITNYLLEKSRIVRQGEKERNYHLFYELLSSLDNASKERHHLKNFEDYKYLVHDGAKVPYTTHSDRDGLAVLLESWHALGLPKEEMDLCLRVVSAILHLGNLSFKQSADADKSTVTNPNVAEIAATELGVETNQLIKVITMKLTQTANERLWSPVRVSQAVVNRDSIAKQIYSEFFDRLVATLNNRLAPPDAKELGEIGNFRTIALLDIYGFENFPTNSLEQFCINYTNENLQRFFNFYIFELEQEEYRKEKIDWQYIQFPDNEPIIKLIAEKPTGIIHICNDEASLATGTDQSFLRACQRIHRDHPNFEIPRVGGDTSFGINHFAGQIIYEVEGFVDKNREQMRAEVLALLTESKQPAVASMFKGVQMRRTNVTSPGPKLKHPMVLSTFNASLQTLMEKMKLNRPHFVRCIKPNLFKQPMVFEDSIVLDQLRYTGVLEATRIRKSGFPVRPTYQDFVDRYGFLISKKHHQRLRSIEDPQEAASYLIQHLSISVGEHGIPTKGVDYELGESKLFMRNEMAANLDAICTVIQHRAARIIQEAWRRRGDGLYERARHNAATVIQSYYRGYRTRRQYPYISRYVAHRTPVEHEPEEPSVSLSDAEICRLEIPSDLAFILDEKPADQNSWLEVHKVAKPSKSIRRLLSNNPAGGWQTYGRPVWDAQPLSYILRGPLGYRLAPRKRPILLTQATESQQAAVAAASKLVLRLTHVPEQPIVNQYLIGSYLYQLCLVNKSLHKEILAQLLSQSVNWPDEAAIKEESDKEDEESLFETGDKDNSESQTYSLPDGKWKRVIRERNPVEMNDLQRRAFRRLWMHVAGVLTCGRLSGTLKPVIVRFLRQYGPARSVPLCEDRLVLAPSVARLYPPCLLEWRVNYTGSNMGISINFPDGISSLIHVGCFTRAETLAGIAMALRAHATRALTGWTISFHTPSFILDLPGHSYVMDVFSAFELPSVWSHLNKILPNHVFPTYVSHPTWQTTTQGTNSYSETTDDWMNSYQHNGIDQPDYLPPVNAQKLAKAIHGIETNDIDRKIIISKPPMSPSNDGQSNLRGSWSKAIRNMALKRFGEVSRSESTLRRASSRRERKWRKNDSPFFPRPKSPADVAADVRFTGGPPDSPLFSDPAGVRKSVGALPHEMRYYTYERPNWSIQLRKEHITPRERIRTNLVLTMIFTQVVTDAKAAINPRLRPVDRQAVLSMVGEQFTSNWPDSLPKVPLDIKKRVVSTSLKFPLYFGRFYPVLSLDSPISANDCHWLVVAHHGIRVVFQNRDRPEFDLHETIQLNEIKNVGLEKVVSRPRWRLGDGTPNDQMGNLNTLDNEPKPVELPTVSKNLVEITTVKDKTYRFYSDLATRIQENIQEFLKEYEQEMQRLKDAANKRALKSYVGFSSPPTHIELKNSRSTPDLSQYACSPPLFTASFPQRDLGTPTSASPFPSFGSDTSLAAPKPSKQSSITPQRQNSDASTIRLSPVPRSSTLNRPMPTSGTTPAPSHPIIKDRRSQTLTREAPPMSPPMSPLAKIPERPKLPVEVVTRPRTVSISQEGGQDHPLWEYASQNFANKQNILEQLSWQPPSQPFKPLLSHNSASDANDAHTIRSLILEFCRENGSDVSPHVAFRSLVGLIKKRPWLNNELYCQVAKQTYHNQRTQRNATEVPWILWALVSIFVETSPELRPHLVRYAQTARIPGNKQIGASIDTIVRSMDLVSKYGPRKRLPPDNVLKTLASGELYHKQQVHLPNKTCLLATVGQLSLVRDAIRGLVDQLCPQNSKLSRDFSLFLAPSSSNAVTYEDKPLIPLEFDEYLLDCPVYDQSYALYFRRVCWTVTVEHDRNTQAMLNYLFDQVSEEYLGGYWLFGVHVSSANQLHNECARISSWLYQGRDENGPITSAIANTLKPRTLNVETDHWRIKLNENLTMSKCISSTDARSKFLRHLEHWQFFGTQFFYARLNSIPPGLMRNVSSHDTVMIALTRIEVALLDRRTREKIYRIRYEDVASTRVNYQNESDVGSAGTVTLITSNGQQFVLQMEQAKMFIFILNRYQNVITAEL